MRTTQDKELLAKKGITEAQIAEQLACFQTGFPYLKLDAAASIEKGILAPDAEDQKAYLAAWDAYKNTDKIIVKFVPASGAASRMFKNLFEFLSAEYDKPCLLYTSGMVDRILTGEMFARSKPAPDCFLLGMEIFGATPENSYVFEDSFHGLQAGMTSGATVIGLATTNTRCV